jgi:hypothetical protein
VISHAGSEQKNKIRCLGRSDAPDLFLGTENQVGRRAGSAPMRNWITSWPSLP